MNPIQLMELHKESFTQNDLAIYRAIKANPEQVISKTTSTLAADCGVSQPALSRFVKSLGYARYRDFRSDLTAAVAQQAAVPQKNDDERLPYFSRLHATLELAEGVLTEDLMRETASYLLGHSRIYATGRAKSHQPAELMEILMRRNRIGVHAVSSDYINELVDYIDSDALLVVFSVSGRADHLSLYKDCAAPIMLVTANPNYERVCPIGRAIVLPYSGLDAENASVSPVLFDIFVELLTSYCSLKH